MSALPVRHQGEAGQAATFPLPTLEGDWYAASTSELIECIVGRYHAVHRRQLPELIDLAQKVEVIHIEDPACPTGLAAQLREMARELDNHMRKEEDQLFPLLARDDAVVAEDPIRAMRNEHEEHGHQLRRLVELAHDLTPPPYACASWRALYGALGVFRADLLEHIHLENDILFARSSRPAGP